MGRLDRKIRSSVAADLSSLPIDANELMPMDTEPLDIDKLFGRGAHERRGKTRLLIVQPAVSATNLFWMSRKMPVRFGMVS